MIGRDYEIAMKSRSLCMPFDNTSCFRCCPPIRPPGYDHLFYVSSLKREFRENRERFYSGKTHRKPVVGFWCWALGYLDVNSGTVGCLLHPAQNRGVDLRFLTGYGIKCARELCYEALQFDKLSEESRLFWIELAGGLNSFYFSSPRANPLFHLLCWGPSVLELLKNVAKKESLTPTEMVWYFPFLLNKGIAPRAWRLPVEIAIDLALKKGDYEELPNDNFFERVKERWKDRVGRISTGYGEKPYVHSLEVEDSLKDFVRFFLGIKRMSLDRVMALREILTEVVAGWRSG